MTARSFLNGLRDIIDNNAYNNPTPQDVDRLFISDESAVADPGGLHHDGPVEDVDHGGRGVHAAAHAGNSARGIQM